MVGKEYVMEKGGIAKKEVEYLYKYRSLANPLYFLDILANNRIYGALFTELNDPMEGSFIYRSNISEASKIRLRDARRVTRVCSFSKRNNIGLLWAHYADNFHGCCIKLRVTSKVWERLEVDYTDKKTMPDANTDIHDLFKHKSSPWSYEEEVRYINYPKEDIKGRCSKYISVKIEAIYMGYKMPDSEFNIWKEIIEKVVGKVDENIEVKKIKYQDIDFGFK